MKKLSLLTLCLCFLAGSCSKSPVDEPTPEPGGGSNPPATTLPAGTAEDPIGIDLLTEAVGKTSVWIEGHIVGSDEATQALSVPKAANKSNILLAARADEADRAKCVRIDLEEGSDLQAHLNIVDHPTLMGAKVKIQGDITAGSTAGSVNIANITAQQGGKEPIVTPPDEPEPPVTGNVELDKLYGYGAATTGGAGATAANTHHFDTGTKFRDWLQLREKNKSTTPAIVWLSGKFTKNDGRATGSPWFDIKRTQNITIYGTNDFVMENVGFFLNEAKNIIIRNVYIKMPKADNGADGISMQESENVWVDHCTFESLNATKDYEDGSCDITHGTFNVTVSWNHFIRTQKSCLVGHSDSQTSDMQISATFHHNFFDQSNSRHPRVRYGKAHVYNNFFNQVSTYGTGSAMGAMVLVEDNCFDGVTLPTDICTFPAKQSGSSWVSNLTGKIAGYLYERGNVFRNKPANARDPYPFTNVEYKAYGGEKLATPYTYDNFKPAYSYVVDDAEQLSTIVPSGAGVGRLQGYTQAPIAVDNGGITTPTDPEEPTDPDTPTEPGGSDIGNGWTAMSYGAASATATVNGNSLTLSAMGKFESSTQTFGFVYREFNGDFVLTVQVDSYATEGTSNQSLAGLMMTPNPAAEGTNLLHALSGQGPASAYYMSSRVGVANASRGTLTAPAAATGAKPILKLERTGDKLMASYSLDGGATFGKTRDVTFATALPETLYIGVAVNSGNSTKSATATLSNFTINGVTTPFAK